MTVKVILFVVLAVLVLLPVGSVSSRGNSNTAPAFLKKGPSKFVELQTIKLKTLDGKDFNWGQTEGKSIFINVWATWCQPCVAEMPSLQKLYNRMNKDVVFVFISIEKRSAVVPFMAYNKFSFPVYFSEDFVNEVKLTNLLYVSAIPFTYIIPSSRQCSYQYIGNQNWNTSDMRKFLKTSQC